MVRIAIYFIYQWLPNADPSAGHNKVVIGSR